MIPLVRLALSVLETTPQRWIQLVEKLPPELLQRKPAPKEWSGYDCLQHIVDTERSVFPPRVGFLLRGEDFPAYYPGKEGEDAKKPPAPSELAGEFVRLRERSLALLSTIGEADLNRTAQHQELGMVTLGEMIHEWAGARPDAHGPGREGDPAAVHRRLRTLEAVFYRPCRSAVSAGGSMTEMQHRPSKRCMPGECI